jgi:D-beta-D-heptose 7-phosphate kinase/D-beta-D-heptose 1-phosphate adenosyltransferase
LKGSKEFQKEEERLLIVENLRLVDGCFLSIDKDRTVLDSIKMIFNEFGKDFQLAFANGVIKIMLLSQKDKFVKNWELNC